MRKVIVLLLLSALSAGLAGCSAKTLDPSQISRFRPTPAVNVILNSLGVAEETPVAWESAQEPQPGDIVGEQGGRHSLFTFRNSGDIFLISVLN